MDRGIDSSVGQGFSAQLRRWRRANALKQQAVAQLLAVSQAAVSRWESGHDLPSPRVMERLRDLMTSQRRDDLAIERLLLSRQGGLRAIFDLDGGRLVGTSRGLAELWPGFTRLSGRCLQDEAIGEMRQIIADADLIRDIRKGEVALISGTSIENVRFRRKKLLHRWHLGFRFVGARMVADLSDDLAPPDDPIGIHEVLRLDQL